MGPLSGLALVAHGGVWGAVAEVGVVFAALALFGFFLWRSKRKEEMNRSAQPDE